ncbi:MAG: hypothetical protein H6813_06545 [Phycisphaeraceae bacterium]|nr:hypothetical protein [Phycisphaeraceae bacterium]MCB9848131.1 hypothetical protein [Phycisphaeraceae bacterium]
MTTSTQQTNPNIATGVARSLGEGAFTLEIPGSSYRIRLASAARPHEGRRCSGVITAQAKRIDKIRGGGAFLEPVEGRPRRAQGRVRAIDKSKQTVTVHTGAAPIVFKTDARQKAEDFEIGEMVTLGVEPGAEFTPNG